MYKHCYFIKVHVEECCMNFQGLAQIGNADWFIDLSFRQAKKRGDELRGQVKGTRLEKSKKIEMDKLVAIRNISTKHLKNILLAFPSLDGMAEFYQELVKATLDYEKLKKSLGALNWAIKRINDQTMQSTFKIKKTQDLNTINAIRREYYGRFASIIKQINPALTYLETARKTMRTYPSIKQNMFTVALAGFPNVGKTTLLTKLTPSSAQVADYAFTTLGLNVGYLKRPDLKIQYIDTPGTLDRFEKMNAVEKQAYLAIKYCADVVVYVIDVTEPYPLADQLALMERLKGFHKEMIVYYSKADVADEQVLEAQRAKLPGFTSAELLEEELIKRAK
ncbi:GTP-binding protein [Candidatus Woesearchaeota archaeon]|nr:MAG: GTP-binding protein [Candidatus Woesearchaeota archaeon]